MAPLSAADEAAVRAFFSSRRGARALIADSIEKLTGYIAAKGTTLRELPTARPADTSRLEDWLEEWRDMAVRRRFD